MLNLIIIRMVVKAAEKNSDKDLLYNIGEIIKKPFNKVLELKDTVEREALKDEIFKRIKEELNRLERTTDKAEVLDLVNKSFIRNVEKKEEELEGYLKDVKKILKKDNIE